MSMPWKDWKDKEQIIGTSGGYITLSGTTEQYSSVVDMVTDGDEAAHVAVEINYDAAPANQVIIKLYGSLDGVIFDNTPLWELQGDHSIDPQRLSVIVEDLAYWRLGVVQAGADSHQVRAYLRTWRH